MDERVGGPFHRRQQVNGMAGIGGAGGAVVAGAIGAIAHDPCHADVGVRFHPRNGGQEVLAIRAGRRYVRDVQNQFTVEFGAHGHFEAVEAMGGALAAVAHLGIRDADDAVRRRALADLRGALGVQHQVIAQNLGQQPTGGPHFGGVDLSERQIQRSIRIRDQRLELRRPGRWVGPGDVGFAVRVQVRGNQALGGIRQTVALTRYRIAQLFMKV